MESTTEQQQLTTAAADAAGGVAIPTSPVVVIEAGGGGARRALSDLWNYRDLLYILALRDIKVRYKQTALGVAWAVLQPLVTMLIFTLLFGRLAGIPSDGVPYPIFAFAGLLPWTFFANSVSNSGNSLVGNANLITKVYFPRMIIPAASVASGLLDFVIGFFLLALLMAWYGIVPGVNLLILPVLIALISLLAAGVGLWTSALNVKYRDIRYALPFVIQLGMFATPIIYPLSMVPEKWRPLLLLNPLTGIVEGFRSALFGRPIDWVILAVSAILTILILTYAGYTFKKMERSFADIV